MLSIIIYFFYFFLIFSISNIFSINFYRLDLSKFAFRIDHIKWWELALGSSTYLLLSPLEGLDEWLQWQEVRATMPESWPLECKDVADASRPFKVPVDLTACFPPPLILKIARGNSVVDVARCSENSRRNRIILIIFRSKKSQSNTLNSRHLLIKL